ncbi:MAG: alpha/beta hydrolase [Bacteroidota bacterium]
MVHETQTPPLSDLWGHEKADWIKHYVELLRPYFDCQYYDCCELGEVSKSPYEQESLHQQFIDGGIEKAVEKLVELEQEEVSVLAFSVGGTITWKATLEGLKTKQLWAVSATRLRYETECSDIPIRLFFGEKDKYRPKMNWLEKMKVGYQIFPEHGHNLYLEDSCINVICSYIIE